MQRTRPASVHAIEIALSIAVLLVALVMSTDAPVGFPTRPAVGDVPLDPELLVPGLLGLASLGYSIRRGLGIVSVLIGLLGAVTVALAAVSLHTLYSGSAAGVFGGGLLTLSVGIPLALFVLGVGAVDLLRRGDVGSG
ncbi:hypothetical protein [Halovivax limisalsi]|uniref:hypothetical protein n=1 Tax=Halovivax limisalsi TaxID=1453760 RepID=UPI001FFC5A0F|nr:hypothetical protein [Halovivax limisalsi]